MRRGVVLAGLMGGGLLALVGALRSQWSTPGEEPGLRHSPALSGGTTPGAPRIPREAGDATRSLPAGGTETPNRGPARLRGHVVEAKTRTPVSGAEVTIAGGGISYTARTDTAGSFGFTLERPGVFRLVRVQAEGFVALGETTLPPSPLLRSVLGKEITGWRIALVRAVDYRLRVVDPDKTPLAGAQVRGTSPEPWNPRVTDAQGDIRWVGPNQRRGQRVTVTAPGFASETTIVRPRRVAVVVLQGLDDAPLTSLAGRVEDESGHPITGVILKASPLEGRPLVGYARTDTNGRFEIPACARGDHRIVASHPSVSRPVGIVATCPQQGVRVVLARAGRVLGTVRDRGSGLPVSSFSVQILNTEVPLHREVETQQTFFNPLGAFELQGFGERSFGLRVVAPGYAASSVVELQKCAPPCTVVIAMGPAGRVVGRVVDRTTGEPLPNVQVTGEGALTLEGLAPPPPVQTDGEGRFAVEGVPPGRRSLTFTIAGYVRRIVSAIDVPPGETAGPIDIDLAPSDAAQGRLELTGIGAVLAPEGGALLIQTTLPTGGAAQAGLREGDRIVEIDGVPVDSLTFRDAAERLRGEVGTQVRLTVHGADHGALRSLVVERRRIQG